MFGAPSIVPCGGPGAMLRPGNNLVLPRGVIRSPRSEITHATTRRIAGMPQYRADLSVVNRKRDVDREKTHLLLKRVR